MKDRIVAAMPLQEKMMQFPEGGPGGMMCDDEIAAHGVRHCLTLD